MDRRSLILGGAAALAVPAIARAQHAGHPALPAAPSSPEPFARLQGGGPHHMTPEQEAQRVTDSPAPKGPAGRWQPRAALPLPRSEMAWATSWAGRMHIVGGYGEGRVDRPYHHVYNPAADQWLNAAPLPRGANHVSVAADAGRVYALGGFTQQNRGSDSNAYAYDIAANRWDAIAPLPRPRGAGAAVALNGRIHLIGGASEPAAERASVGGRFNTFEYNTDLHHVYLPERDTWERRAALPTARSGHGLVVYRDRLFAMGGESGVVRDGKLTQEKVFGQMESYDPASDSWQSHAPMLTPRHAVGATAIGDAIYVADGGAVLGGAVQSAIHEAFTLG